MPINERRKAAEEWALANFRHNPEGRGDGWQYEDYVVPAHLAGQECGEKREREAVVRFIRRLADSWHDPSHPLTDVANLIARGEHPGGE